jgi:hypothetical protein
MEACTDTGAASGNEELDCPVADTGSSAAPTAAAAKTTEAPSSGNEDDTKDKEEKDVKKNCRHRVRVVPFRGSLWSRAFAECVGPGLVMMVDQC